MILSLLAVSFVAQEGGHGDGGHNAEMQFVQTLGRVIALGDAVAPGWREDDGKHRHRRGSCNPLTDLLLNSAISKPITALFQPNCECPSSSTFLSCGTKDFIVSFYFNGDCDIPEVSQPAPRIFVPQKWHGYGVAFTPRYLSPPFFVFVFLFSCAHTS